MPLLRSIRPRRPAWRAVVLAAALAGFPAAGQAQGPAVVGRVVDSAGRPAADVAVAILPLDGAVPAAAGARTDAGGWFRISAPGVGRWRVLAAGPEGRSAEAVLDPLLVDTGLEPLALAPSQAAPPGAAGAGEPASAERNSDGSPARPADIRGRVTARASATAVAGAVVWLRGHRAWAVTSEDGTFLLPARLPAAGGLLEVRGAEWLPWTGGVGPGGREPLAIALEPAAVLAGEVVDSSGRPAASVGVAAGAPEPRQPDLPWPAPTFTGPDGRFVLAQVPASTPVRVEAGSAGRPRGARRLRGLAPGPPRGLLRLVLRSRPAVAGTVVDAAGAPLAGIAVRLEWAHGADDVSMPRLAASAPGFAAASGADGRFEIVAETAGTFDFVALVAGERRYVLPGIRLAEESGRVDLGRIALPADAALEGRVTDPRGGAVAGAEVAVRRDPELPWEPAARTDERGAFQLPRLRAGRPCDLRVSHPRFAPATVAGVVPGESPRVEVVLEPGTALAGRVIDHDGSGVPGAEVELRIAAGGVATSRQVATAGDGTFAAGHLEAGELTVIASAEGYRRAELAVGPISADRPPADLIVELQAAAILRGTVRHATGEPVAEARISVTAEPGGEPWATVIGGADGRFEIAGLPIGPAALAAAHPRLRRAERRLELEAGEQSVELVMADGTALTGRVADEDGAPVSGARIRLASGAAGSGPTAESGADGAFEFAEVAPGEHTLHAARDGYAPAAVAVAVADGSAADPVVVTLRRGARVEGRLVGVEAADLGEVEVAAIRLGEEVRTGQVSAEGRYVVDGLAPGRWQLAGRSPRGPAREEVEVTPGERLEVDLSFAPGLTLTGTVRAGGEPVPGAEVAALDPRRGSAVAATTDATGRFRLSGLAAGELILHVERREGGLGHQQTLILDDSREVEVDLAVEPLLGRVVDASGLPVAGARVDLVPAAGAQTAQAVTARTDQRGEFRFALLARGAYDLRARAPGGAEGALRLDHGGGLAADVVVVVGSEPE